MPKEDEETGFGKFLDTIERLAALAVKINESGGIERSGEIGNLPKGGVGRYQISVRPLSEEKFKPPRFAPSKDLAVEVFDEGDCVLVVAEFRGDLDREIEFDVRPGAVYLTLAGAGRVTEVRLPCRVDPKTASSTCRNGIFRLTVAKER